MQRRRSLLAVGAALSLALATGLLASFAGDAPPDPYAGRVAKANDDWKKTIQRMQFPKGSGLVATKWAAEPLVANMVAFAFDGKGRCYVAETFRLHKGVTDNRGHMYWLDDDLACRTVEDRVAMYRKHHANKFVKEYETEMDRVRLVEDTDGDGVADKSTVFSDGYKEAADGIGSGVLAHKGKVWFTNIPSLWLLEDTKGTGRADIKKALSTGYGIHVAFLGHDMHGLKMGPDGKIYFSIGDRGLNVKTEGRHLFAPDTGSVLRCNPDGSELEIVASGLRNPQELAFDEYGNLFTGDNNADGGDKARWVHLVEGGDSGWRIGYQYLPALGPWNAERIWHTQPTNTASYVLPPLAHIGNGPSGLTYHPGTSQLPEKYQRHFFLCDFRGNGGGSGIHSFALKAKGASFEVGPTHQFVWSVLATDGDFGPDGAFYVSDWVDGWGLTNKGRIFKITDPTRKDDPLVAEVKKLLAEGFDHRPVNELTTLLGHADMRVRQESQFALVEKKAGAELAKVATGEGKTLPRIHAIWGLGQLGRKDAKQYQPLIALASDKDAEVRAQALKILGDGKVTAALEKVIAGLKDAEPRVRFFAAMAAGKLGNVDTVPALLEVAKANADTDPYLRHAVSMALSGINDKAATQKAAESDTPSVRLTALLALRRQGDPEVAKFLSDADPKLVLEAARAIYDGPIPAALPKLAALSQPTSSVKGFPVEVREPVWQRALAAHYRLGGKDDVAALLAFAGRADAPEKLREEALKMLSAWEKPSGRDRVVGLWRPIPERPGTDVAALLKTGLAPIMSGPAKVRSEGAKLAAKHGIKEVGPVLRQIALDSTQPVSVRVETLKALDLMKDAKLVDISKTLLKDDSPRLRHQARVVDLKRFPAADAAVALRDVLGSSSVYEQQGALALLADLKSPIADEAIGKQLDQLLKGTTPAELQLDLLEAARKRKDSAVAKKLAEYEGKRPKDDKLAPYKETLVGGDAENGRAVFAKSELSCIRCHKVNGNGGEVGPELAGIGKKQKRDYLLESLVDPSKQIAKGYDTVVLVLKNGQIKTGVLKSDTAKEVRLMTAEGQLVVVPTIDIDERQRGPSAMPADLVPKMSRHELRDLIEYLSGL